MARTTVGAVVMLLVSGLAASASSNDLAPDGTPIACRFALALKLDLSGDASFRTCGGFEFSVLGHPTNPRAGSVSITDMNTRQRYEYHFADMIPTAPNGPVYVTQLQDADRNNIRVLATLYPDRIAFIVGERQFVGPFPATMRSRPQEAAPARRSSGSAAGRGSGLVGRWESTGYGLNLRPDGTFTEYYFGSSFNPLPERTGRYAVHGDRVDFTYDRGLPAGRLPENCAWSVDGNMLSFCNGTLHRRNDY